MSMFIRRLFSTASQFLATFRVRIARPKGAVSTKPSRLTVEALEPRILYSAAPVEPVEASPSDASASENAPVQQSEAATAAGESAPVPTPIETVPAIDSIAASPDRNSTVADPISGNASFPQAPISPAANAGTLSNKPAVSLVDVSTQSAPLNQQTLEAVAEAARQHWIDTGLSERQVAALDEIEYEIDDIGGNRLGKANGFTVTIDDDAAGSDAWFVDMTPGLDEEFLPASDHTSTALPGSAAAGRYDLLSAVLHEQGHVLGLGHDHGENAGLMGTFLGQGTRTVPVTDQARGAEPGSIVGDAFLSTSIVRVSTDSLGGESNAESRYTGISANGRFVVFQSNASNLVNDDTNGVIDVFVKDLETGEITRVSESTLGSQGNDSSYLVPPGGFPIRTPISDDGRYVVFLSSASNLVNGDTNGIADVFVKDLDTGILKRVNTSSSGGEADAIALDPSISGDGQRVVFSTQATNLDDFDDDSFLNDIFVKNLSSGVLTRVTRMPTEPGYKSASDFPSISANGQFVAFVSSFPFAGGTNESSRIFVKNLSTGTFAEVDDGEVDEFDTIPALPLISPDGRYVAFTSSDDSLVAGDTNQRGDLFVKDLTTGNVTRVNTNSDGEESESEEYAWHLPSFSSDGRYIAFTSAASDLVADDTNGFEDVFVKDTLTGEIVRASSSATDTQTVAASHAASISGNGQLVAFESWDFNLVPNDTNWTADIFVKDLLTSLPTYTTEVSTDSSGNLIITDIGDTPSDGNPAPPLFVDGGNSNDRLTIHTEGNELVISDPDNGIGSTFGGASQTDPHEVRINLSAFSGDIIVRTRGGDDSIIAYDLFSLPGGIVIQDGSGDDEIRTGDVRLTGDSALIYTANRIIARGDIETQAGAIRMTATGSPAGGTAGRNSGIEISNASLKTSDGDIVLTGQGTEGKAVRSASGVSLRSSHLEISGDGSIEINGTGAVDDFSGRHGIFVDKSSLRTFGAGNILLNGIGGGGKSGNEGVTLRRSGIASESGSLQITGTAQNNTSGNNNRGVHSTSTHLRGASVSVDGTGGGGVNGNEGIRIVGGSITATAGAVSISGDAHANTSGSRNSGVYLNLPYQRNTILVSAIDGVSIDGGGGGGTNANYGIYAKVKGRIDGGSGSVTAHGIARSSTTGSANTGLALFAYETSGNSVSLTGTGGGGTNNNHGIDAGNGDLSATGGILSIRGNAHTDTIGSSNIGVKLRSTPLQADNGIDVLGIGGGGKSSNYGVYAQARDIDAGTGNVAVEGRANSTTGGSKNMGIFLDFGNISGNFVSIHGTGGGGKSSNRGVEMKGDRSATTEFAIRANERIDVNGTAQSGTTGSGNAGVFMRSSIPLVAPGDISIQGTGGGGTSKNYGAYVSHPRIIRTTEGGSLLVQGTASADTTGSNNTGVFFSTGSIAADSVRVEGTGGGGTSNNQGVRLTVADVVAGSGDIAIEGSARSTTQKSANEGVWIKFSALTAANGISVTGNGGGGTSKNSGVFLSGSPRNHSLDGGSGDISIMGSGNASTRSSANHGVSLRSATVSTLGNIAITGTSGSGTSSNVGTLLKSVELRGGDDSVLQISGTAHANTSGNSNRGIYNTGNFLVVGSQIAFNGVGGGGKNNNEGLKLSGDIRSTVGDLTVNGLARADTSGSRNNGLYIKGDLRATNGNVLIDGTGGGGRDRNIGAYLFRSTLRALGGNLEINGTARSTTGGVGNLGINLTSTQASAAHNSSVAGTGGGGTKSNVGIYLHKGGVASGTAGGTNSLIGFARTNTRIATNHGIFGLDFTLQGSTINVEGSGGGGLQLNHGIYVRKVNAPPGVIANGTAGQGTGSLDQAGDPFP